MLFMGILYQHQILVLLGNTMTFLVIAALGGLGWSIHSLFDP